MKNQIIISLLFLSIGLSQRLSEVIETYENGNVKSITYHKKTRDGIQKVKEEGYFEKGQKEFEGSYKDGKKDGLWTVWYENGQKKEEITFKNGKRDGLETEWWSNGQKINEMTYKDGKEWDGKWTSWSDDENKLKVYEETYKDGELISQKDFNPDGSVME